ncbi:hypothetical protein [Leucobacter sp.]
MRRSPRPTSWRPPPTHHRLYVAQIANRGAHPAADVVSKAVVDAMNYWAEQSEGNATMSWEAWYTYNSASATVENKCGLSVDMAAFNAVVTEAQTVVYPSVDFTTSANHLIVLVPEACMSGGRVGVASSGLNFSSGGRLAAYTGASGPGALAHEIGHNLGFGHEYGWYCGNPCQAVVYGDVYGVMGSNVIGGLPAMSTPFREHHGILGAGEMQTVRSDTTLTLQPRSARSGLRSLKVPDAQNVVFYIDYRSGTGRDANTYSGTQVWPMSGFNSVYPPGVTILYRIDSQQGMPETYLQTYPRQSVYSGSLAQGQSFKSPVSDLRISVGPMTSSGAQVSLRFGGQSPSPPRNPGPFADVPNTHKFATEINWMHATGLSTGVRQAGGKPKYLPKSSVSREAMAAFLYRLDGARFTGPKQSPFADVPPSHKFYDEISWMYFEGLSTGVQQRSGKPKYLPKSSVSREAMAAFLYRLDGARYGGPRTSPFADVATSHRFYDEIAWMRATGLSTGVQQVAGKPKYLPKSSVSREAMAAFLYRHEH